MDIIPVVLGRESTDFNRTVQSPHTVRPDFAPSASPESWIELAKGGFRDGAWLLPVMSGDVVSPELGDILGRIVETDRDALVYWDEDRSDSEGRCDPWIKPDWDHVLFDQLGGLAGASAVSASALAAAVDALPGLSFDRSGLERLLMWISNSEDQSRLRHIPLILTHRSKSIPRRRAPASRTTPTVWPTVSIIIPTRDRPDLLSACWAGIRRTSYPASIETIVIDNGSIDPTALRVLAEIESDPNARVLRDPRPFNFAQLSNLGAADASGEFLCFLNNDVEPLHDQWLAELIAWAVLEHVGAVGAQLLYPSGRIQHAGVAIGLGGAAGHVQRGADPGDEQFATWHNVTREVSAVTAATMVVSKANFSRVGGFDEAAFPVAFNDIDLCLKLKQAGLRNIYVAEARLLHRESESRGDDRSAQHRERFSQELQRLQERWQTRDHLDPHFSPLFAQSVERCVLAP